MTRNRRIDATEAINQVTRTLLNLMRIEVLLGIGLVLWVFSIELHAENYAPLEHPEFSPDVKIIACEPIKYSNRESPTFYWYALDIENSKGWQLTSDTYRWSDTFDVEKSPNYLMLRKPYSAVEINRKTLRPAHKPFVDSDCELSSLEDINQQAAQDASNNTI